LLDSLLQEIFTMAMKVVLLLVILQILRIQASEVCDGPGGDRVLCPQLTDDLEKKYCCPPGYGEICCIYEDRYEENTDYGGDGGDYGGVGEANPVIIYAVVGVLAALILGCIGLCCFKCSCCPLNKRSRGGEMPVSTEMK